MKKNRNVGIVAVGQTAYSSHREDVNQPEMIHEAVKAALDQSGLTMNDVDCVVSGNMELFEMVHQPDLWHTLGMGTRGKETLRVTTGGTTGAPLSIASTNGPLLNGCSWPVRERVPSANTRTLRRCSLM